MNNYEKIMSEMTVDKMAEKIEYLTSYGCEDICPVFHKCSASDAMVFDCSDVEVWKKWLNSQA